jgi:DNA-binding response OmpR family regulator
LKLAQHGDFDAIVLDVMLPGLSGYEVVRRLRSQQLGSGADVVCQKTGSTTRLMRWMTAPMTILTDPSHSSSCWPGSEHCYDAALRARPVVLSAGDVQLDPASREVWVDGTPANLTLREFVLLEYLIRNAGRVVGKAELLAHVWANAADVAPNAVEVYVGYLRRKIGNDRLITVRGVGYRLAA